MSKILPFLLSLLSAAALSAATPDTIAIPTTASHFSLVPHMQYHISQENIETIADFETISSFERSAGESFNFCFSPYPIWLKTKLRNPLATPAEVVIEINSPLIDELTLYFRSSEEGVWRSMLSGEVMPQAARSYSFARPVFPFRLEAGEEIEIALMYRDEGTVPLPITIWRADSFNRHQNNLLVIYGIYYGILIAMLAYNFVLYFTIAEKTYLYYVLYVASFALFQFTDNGLTHYYFSNYLNGEALNTLYLFLTQLFIYFLLLFSRSILRTDKYMPSFERYLRTVGVLFVTMMAISPFLEFASAAKTTIALGVIVPLSIAIATLIAIKRGSNLARYFFGAFSIFLVGSSLWGLRTAGVVPFNSITENAMQLGSAAEMILLSMILSFRISRLKRQKYEQEQLAAREYLTISEHSPDAILRFNSEGTLIYANKQSALLPCSVGALQKDINSLAGELGQQIKLIHTAVMAGETVTPSVLKVMDSHEEKHIELRVTAEKDLNDVISSTLFLLRDISEDYTLREKLRQTEKMNVVGQLAGGGGP